MQLFLNTDADIGIRKNMSVIERESLSLDTKIGNDDDTDKIKSVTEVNNTSEDLENCTDNIIETDNDVVNGEECDTQHINSVANDENNDELSLSSEEILSKEEEVDESIKSNNQNEKDINTNLQVKTNTFHEPSENDLHNNINNTDHIEKDNNLDNSEDNNEDICNEIEPELHKSDDEEITEDVLHEQIVTKESDLTTTEKQIILDTVTENVSCEELDSNLNDPDVRQQEIQEQDDSDKPREIEMETEINEKNESDKQDVAEIEFNMRVKNVSEINEKVLETCIDNNKEIENSVKSEMPSKSINDEIFDLEEETDTDSNQRSSDCVKNDEIIDIADEKDDECVTVIDDKACEKVKKEQEKELKLETMTENNVTNTDVESTKQDNVSLENKNNNEESNTLNNENLKENISELITEESKEIVKETAHSAINIKEKKPLLHISKLSNTLDILSDDDEEEQVPKAETESKEDNEKQCISIEDDDDIMLIDEETNDNNKNDNSMPPETDVQHNEENKQTTGNDNNVTMDVDVNSEELPPESEEHEKEKEIELKDEQLEENSKQTEEKPSSPTPLLPVNFFKSCKKNFAEMTREELEEFCVLKIVESVVDRSNLSEMNLQLKAMSQNIEDYKKKTVTLIKQNRDLQVVLKSIQEEQKKNSGQAITPLKITRSVGMQVLMIETPITRKKPMPSYKFPTNSINPARCKSQSPKTPKGPTNNNTNNQQIPVPRLVPAVNNASNNKQSSPVSPKVQNVPNGVKGSPPVPKPEKRSFNKMQQGNSVTVDLTDDEPPPKVVPRNIAPPVRLVPQQSLLTAQRPQFINTVNSPRKVYIPISGSQNPVTPGQTIMLKPVQTHVPRMRGPSVVQKPNNSVRLPRIAPKHPAPLPDSMTQYQPPNWKALPPAPELKLSKVENGIVISWKIDGYQEENHEEIASYQLYAYQETSSPPSTSLWKKIGDVKALPLPMACTLTQFMAGYKYYFAVRAVDVRSRLGPFSLPGRILLLNKM